ncbi:hypothetical protein MMC07_009829 [Pseudocyphellaria aurata]|nr:hypothetical protein [Pseudocyphellaria aurata]
MDLSRDFESHSLRPSRQNLFYDHPPPPFSRFYPPIRSHQNPTSFNSSQVVLQQRQPMTRQPCNSTHLSKLHSLVEGLVSTGRPRSSYSSSINTASSGYPREDILPDLPSRPEHAPTSSAPSSENEESESSPWYRRGYAQHNVTKNLRQTISPDRTGKQNVVLKRIRYRKSFLKRRSTDSCKRQDRKMEMRLE